MVIFSLYYKRPWLISAVSVLSGYLCCQAPRWFGFLAGEALDSSLADHIFYIAAVFLCYYFLKTYVAGSVRELMEISYKSCLMLGAVPLFYYVFDYMTTIYTDTLYRGTKWAVQFMPSTISVFYFVFVILYSETQNKQPYKGNGYAGCTAGWRRQSLPLQQLQQNAASYRHDMRHHLALLQGLASGGRLQGD